MRTTRPAALAAIFLLTACGGGQEAADSSVSTSPMSTGASSSTQSAPAGTTNPPPEELGTIVASGFGQEKEYVWVTALVHNNSGYVGQTVTVNFNLLDSAGNILKSQSQVESFYAPDADHAVGTQVDLASGERAASVEATVDVEASGAFSAEPFPVMPTSKPEVKKDQYGGYQASFSLTNPLSVALKSPRVGVICRDAAGEIVGGGTLYPDLVPANGKIRVDTHLLLSGEAQDCVPYPGAPSDWDGEGLQGGSSPSASSEEQNPPEGSVRRTV